MVPTQILTITMCERNNAKKLKTLEIEKISVKGYVKNAKRKTYYTYYTYYTYILHNLQRQCSR